MGPGTVLLDFQTPNKSTSDSFMKGIPGLCQVAGPRSSTLDSRVNIFIVEGFNKNGKKKDREGVIYRRKAASNRIEKGHKSAGSMGEGFDPNRWRDDSTRIVLYLWFRWHPRFVGERREKFTARSMINVRSVFGWESRFSVPIRV
jgi:hypothetical protein